MENLKSENEIELNLKYDLKLNLELNPKFDLLKKLLKNIHQKYKNFASPEEKFMIWILTKSHKSEIDIQSFIHSVFLKNDLNDKIHYLNEIRYFIFSYANNIARKESIKKILERIEKTKNHYISNKQECELFLLQ